MPISRSPRSCEVIKHRPIGRPDCIFTKIARGHLPRPALRRCCQEKSQFRSASLRSAACSSKPPEVVHADSGGVGSSRLEIRIAPDVSLYICRHFNHGNQMSPCPVAQKSPRNSGGCQKLLEIEKEIVREVALGG